MVANGLLPFQRLGDRPALFCTGRLSACGKKSDGVFENRGYCTVLLSLVLRGALVVRL